MSEGRMKSRMKGKRGKKKARSRRNDGLETLQKFLPKIVIDSLQQVESQEKAEDVGRNRSDTNCAATEAGERATRRCSKQVKVVEAVTVFADISGFTKTSEQLEKLGNNQRQKRGTEELVYQLNKFWTIVVKHFERNKGDVIKFAGDAVIIAFFQQEEEEFTSLCWRVVNACSTLLNSRDGRRFTFVPRFLRNDLATMAQPMEMQFQLKLGVGKGHLAVIHLGESEQQNLRCQVNKKEYLVIGDALDECFNAQSACENPGELYISEEVYDNLINFKKRTCYRSRSETALFAKPGNMYTSRKLLWEFKWCKEGRYFCVPIKEQPSPHSMGRRVGTIPRMNSTLELGSSKKGKKVLDNAVPMSLLWRYIPSTALPYLTPTKPSILHTDWASEIRSVTIMFLVVRYEQNFLQQIQQLNDVALEGLNTDYSELQKLIYRFGGSVNKFTFDDKGSVMLVVFGLPPFTHEDDAMRAVQCSTKISAYLEQHGLKGSIGITTREAYCGLVGNRFGRIEYSVLGDSVNSAARLMSYRQPAESSCKFVPGQIKIDKPTRLALGDSLLGLEFVLYRDQLQIKGKETPIQTFIRKQYRVTMFQEFASMSENEVLCIIITTGASSDNVLTEYKKAKLSMTVGDLVCSHSKAEHTYIQYSVPPIVSVSSGTVVHLGCKVSSFKLHKHFRIVWLKAEAKQAKRRAEKRNVKFSVKFVKACSSDVPNTLVAETEYESVNQEELTMKLGGLVGSVSSNNLQRLTVKVVTGFCGTGKSHVMNEVLSGAGSRVVKVNCQPCCSLATSNESLWKEIIIGLLRLPTVTENPRRGQRKSGHPNEVLKSIFSSSERASYTAKIPEALGRLQQQKGSFLIVFEQAENIDSLSLKLLNSMLREQSQVGIAFLLVQRSRPEVENSDRNSLRSSRIVSSTISYERRKTSVLQVRDSLASLSSEKEANEVQVIGREQDRLFSRDNVEVLLLSDDPKLTRKLVQSILGVKAVDETFVKILERYGKGNPIRLRDSFFLWKELELIEVVRKDSDWPKLVVRDAPGIQEFLLSKQLPQSIELVCGMYADNFGAIYQPILKVAAILEAFTCKRLCRILQVIGSKSNPSCTTDLVTEEVKPLWNTLLSLRVFEKVAGSKDGEFRYGDAWLQFTIERRILHGQRKAIMNAEKNVTDFSGFDL